MEHGSTIAACALVLGLVGYLATTRSKKHSNGGAAPNRLIPILCASLVAVLGGLYYFIVDQRWTAALVFLVLAVALVLMNLHATDHHHD